MKTKPTRRVLIAAIESLESRRLLAVFGGTAGDDIIRISVSNAGVTVTINGVEEHEISTNTVVTASGGNDTIYLDRLVGNGFSGLPLFFELNAGTGNDLIKFGSTDPANYNLGEFFDFDLIAGAGNDTLELDMLSGASGVFFECMATTPPTVNWVTFEDAEIDYEDDLENCDLDGTAFNDIFWISTKRPSLRMTASGNGGDDQFRVGRGSLDSSGVMNSSTLFGGAGDDLIEIEDWAATPGATYTLNEFSVAKGINTFSYSSFDRQELETADGGGPSVTPNTININAVSSFFDTTMIIGGSGPAPHPPNFVNVGNGDFNTLAGSFNLRLGEGRGSISVNDQSSTTARTYAIGTAGMTTPRLITYNNCDVLTLNCSSASDTVTVSSSALDTALAVNAGGGSDTVSVGGGSFDNYASAVTVTGGAGTDSLIISTILENTLATQTLTSSGFTDGFTHSYSAFEQLTLNGGSGGTNLAINSIGIPVTVNGGSGNDACNIGNASGSLAQALLANVVFNAGGGNDSLGLLGPNDGAQSYAFTSVTQFRLGDASTGKTVSFSGIEQAMLRSGIGGDTIDVTAASVPLSIFSGAGNDAVTIRSSTAPVTVDTGPEQVAPFGFRQGDGLTIGDFVSPPATVVIEQSDTVIKIGVTAGSTLRLANGAILTKDWPTGFFIDLGTDLTGTLDLGSGAFLWRTGGSVIPDFRALLTRGYNAGAWNGTSTQGAINSSLAAASSLPDAIGFGLGSEIAPTTIGGFNIAPGDTLLRYTFYGDADLNGVVNFDDYARTDLGFATSRTGWVNGDFNYDNVINFDDYSLIDLAFNSQGAAASTSEQRLDLWRRSGGPLPEEDATA